MSSVSEMGYAQKPLKVVLVGNSYHRRQHIELWSLISCVIFAKDKSLIRTRRKEKGKILRLAALFSHT